MRRGEREYILMKNFRAEEPEPEPIHSFIHLSMIRLHKIIISMLKKDAWKV